mmetsp:Transcript_4804/g.16823  ORF Transcript_4804/g.16823 Transcript_4804/m.16823 type:complete len:269 (-) Transcript_4804:44-850(-)
MPTAPLQLLLASPIEKANWPSCIFWARGKTSPWPPSGSMFTRTLTTLCPGSPILLGSLCSSPGSSLSTPGRMSVCRSRKESASPNRYISRSAKFSMGSIVIVETRLATLYKIRSWKTETSHLVTIPLGLYCFGTTSKESKLRLARSTAYAASSGLIMPVRWKSLGFHATRRFVIEPLGPLTSSGLTATTVGAASSSVRTAPLPPSPSPRSTSPIQFGKGSPSRDLRLSAAHPATMAQARRRARIMAASPRRPLRPLPALSRSIRMAGS